MIWNLIALAGLAAAALSGLALWSGWAALALAPMGAALAVYGLWIEPRQLRIERRALALAGLSRPLRIVAIGDPQPFAGHWPARRLAEAFARAAAEAPDLVLWLGDYAFESETRDVARIGAPPHETIAAMAELTAPLGAYAVLGNHDWSWGGAAIQRLLAETPIRLLIDEAAEAAPGLWIVGLDDVSTPRAVDLDKAFAAAPPDATLIVLSHSPDAYPMVKAYAREQGRRIALMLSGHTHGGQIGAPLIRNLLAPITHKRYVRGLFEEDGVRLLVTSGMGVSALPLRIGAPPEILVLDLAPARAPAAQAAS